jgi:ribonuclease inhibitor
LWDVLSASVERPVTLIWKRSGNSKQALGHDFDAIIDVFRRVELQDEKFGWKDRFSFVLE